jgi:GTP-binding protein LepA
VDADLASADLRFAAWLAWMTPLETALSRLREAATSSSGAVGLSPGHGRSAPGGQGLQRGLDRLVAQARSFSLVPMRLIWDLILATPDIRNFCIIAHIDHGKSTLADRMLELTGVVDRSATCARSTSTRWTSSASAASRSRRRPCACRGGGRRTYVLNLIDTPGHVDFTYEVSRSLAACEGALLLVDAAQGIEAQTLANLYLAIENDLEIIPVLNKIDLPAAEPERARRRDRRPDRRDPPDDVLRVSAKTGEGVERCSTRSSSGPAAGRRPDAPPRALIFDSVDDQYRGVVTYVRVVDGTSKARAHPDDVDRRDPRAARDRRHLAPEPDAEGRGPRRRRGRLPHHRRQGRPAVCASATRSPRAQAARPRRSAATATQADGVLRPLPDRRPTTTRPARRAREAASSTTPRCLRAGDLGALGFGFRCGFLGLLHMEIVRERLEREFDLDLISHRAQRRLPRRR